MDNRIIANIKSLGIDMINEAKSGHPGIVLGAAPIIYTVYAKHINISINDDKWINRDRFVLSAGHGSALLYATLFMAGYDLSIDDLKNFRHEGYKTPGHPEYGVTPGVDISTGPLGQGLAMAVGMALGSKILGSKHILNKKGKFGSDKQLINYNVYCLCGDGDLMEGISYEAASFAGTNKLNNLIVLYDSNNISLDGETKKTFTENVIERFRSFGWNTEIVKNGNDISSIDKAINKAKKSDKPTLIEIKTIIGNGSVLQGKNEVHGKPLEKEDITQLKNKLGIPDEAFYVDNEALSSFRKSISERSNIKYDEWSKNYQDYINDNLNGDATKIAYLFNNDLKINICNYDWNFDKNRKEATRITNGHIMSQLGQQIPNFIGGSADLSSSTKAYLNKNEDISASNYNGSNIWFGVREHAMGGILNGLATCHFKPFGSTFLVFADYMKPAIRLAALMNLPVTFVFSHDAINVGQDGPTHQPIEQLAMLRSIPNFKVFRPADANEIVGSWNEILNLNSPCALILSRVDANILDTTSSSQVVNGAYIVRKEKEKLDGIIIATGSEVHTAIYIANELYASVQLDIRVVSMPSMELFLKTSKEYQENIFPLGCKKIVVEAGSSFGWEKFVYNSNYLINVNQFGVSGTKEEVLEYCNFDYDTIKDRILKLLK